MDYFDNIRIEPPIAGACRICAAVHDPAMPHDRDSLYYQMRFWQRHQRFPTWNDAMAHCTESVKEQTRARLLDCGILPDAPGEETGHVD